MSTRRDLQLRIRELQVELLTERARQADLRAQCEDLATDAFGIGVRTGRLSFGLSQDELNGIASAE